MISKHNIDKRDHFNWGLLCFLSLGNLLSLITFACYFIEMLRKWNIQFMTRWPCLFCLCLSLSHFSLSHTHTLPPSPHSLQERLILAADMVMKLLNHGPALRSNCPCMLVCFPFLQQLTCLYRLLVYGYTMHIGMPFIDIVIPYHAYFFSQEGPQANYAWINKVPVLLSGVTVWMCIHVRSSLCMSCRTSSYGCRIHKTSQSVPD